MPSCSITIFSTTCTRADLIAPQVDSLRRHLAEWPEINFVVANNESGSRRGDIEAEARRVGVGHLGVPIREGIDGSWHHAHALDWLWAREPADIVGFIDMDMFLFRPWSIRQRMGDHVIAGLPQKPAGSYYPWPGLVFIDKSRCASPHAVAFRPMIGRDTGGMMHDWLAVTQTKMAEFTAQNEDWAIKPHLPQCVQDRYEKRFDWEVHDGSWLHYRNATDWMNKGPEHDRAKKSLLDLLMANTQ